MLTPDEAYDQVRGDATLRAVLKAARSWGVAPSTFLGRAARLDLAVTERDAAGRPARYVDARPAWDDDDRVLALALEDYERGICDGCGFPLEETTNPLNEGRYIGRQAIRCHACTAQGQGAAAMGEGVPHSHALRFPVEFRPATPAQPLEDALAHDQEVAPCRQLRSGARSSSPRSRSD
jgi:hypothetical protein